MTLWTARYGADVGGDDAGPAAVSSDGSTVFVLGEAFPDVATDYVTVAYDSGTGARLWASHYDGPVGGRDSPVGLVVRPAGSTVYVTGTSARDAHEGGAMDITTIAYDATTGTQEWVNRFNGVGQFTATPSAISVSPDGATLFVTGTSAFPGTNGQFATIAYVASNGTRRWVRRFGPRKSEAAAASLAVSPDGTRLVVTGSAQMHKSGGPYSYATVAYDTSDGKRAWVSIHDGPAGSSMATMVAISPDGTQAYVTGFNQRVTGYATIAYDVSTGAQDWLDREVTHKRYEGDPILAVSGDGSRVFVSGGVVAAAGTSDSEDIGTMAMAAATGEKLWRKGYNTPDDRRDVPAAITVSPDGSLIFITGWSQVDIQVEYTTVAYDAADGQTSWVRHVHGPDGGVAQAFGQAVSPDESRLFVTGIIIDRRPSEDFEIVAYRLS